MCFFGYKTKNVQLPVCITPGTGIFQYSSSGANPVKIPNILASIISITMSLADDWKPVKTRLGINACEQENARKMTYIFIHNISFKNLKHSKSVIFQWHGDILEMPFVHKIKTLIT